MRIASIEIGGGAPLALIAGLNVLEDESSALASARTIAEIASRHDLPLIFKASFDKANRSQVTAFRGPGIEAGLEMLAAVKRETKLPVLTDIHEPNQAEIVAQVVDCIQVPAFLCRQTDLLAACAATGLPVNVKKGQFIAPSNMNVLVEKLKHFGCENVLLTDRGTQFGYNNLVADMTALIEMRAFAPVCFDATHSVQKPGSLGGASGGSREFVAPLARAAVAVGIDVLFVEAHPDPENALCDGPSQITFAALDQMLGEVRALDRVRREA
ncbi:MAG: 3-deoxy-8-phosphooctulonate synthase [Myxococcales bacterium]|nr:3-deoxy-8-phosphooctulonate synthase [Myxococcales bacterium]MCH7867786.1 3-deoxy-8-phosphooctulonate synthase [Myxococcales bacterium]